MAVKEDAWRLTQRQREGRAINGVAELLRRTLSVPNIYLEPPVSLISADVLAVDRGGAGDLHAVVIKLLDKGLAPVNLGPRQPTAKEAFISAHRQRERQDIVKDAHHRLMSMPAHFRYLAVSAENSDMFQGELSSFGIYAEDGIGRIGMITIIERGIDSPTAQVTLAPERFRVDPAKLKAIETRLLMKSRPDIEVRI